MTESVTAAAAVVVPVLRRLRAPPDAPLLSDDDDDEDDDAEADNKEEVCECKIECVGTENEVMGGMRGCVTTAAVAAPLLSLLRAGPGAPLLLDDDDEDDDDDDDAEDAVAWTGASRHAMRAYLGCNFSTLT